MARSRGRDTDRELAEKHPAETSSKAAASEEEEEVETITLPPISTVEPSPTLHRD
jgi:hypothetical protein